MPDQGTQPGPSSPEAFLFATSQTVAGRPGLGARPRAPLLQLSGSRGNRPPGRGCVGTAVCPCSDRTQAPPDPHRQERRRSRRPSRSLLPTHRPSDDQGPPVRCEGGRTFTIGLARSVALRLRRLRVPELDGAVAAGRRESCPVGRDRNAPDLFCMTQQRTETLSRGRIPELQDPYPPADTITRSPARNATDWMSAVCCCASANSVLRSERPQTLR